MKFNKDYYSTPKRLINKMLEGIDFNTIKNILEPSAGDGAICEVLEERLNIYKSRYNKVDQKSKIDCIEIEEDMQSILKGKGYRVIGDDFLKYNGYKTYSLIVANVPFSEGDKHVMKFIEMVERGQVEKIRCICNAGTIRNPYSNLRKTLLQKLQKYNASIEFIQNAFNGEDAERKTDVEIALIKIDMPEINENSSILSNLQKANSQYIESEESEAYEVGEQLEYIAAICKQYETETKATVQLIKEVFATNKASLKSFEENSTPIVQLSICGSVKDDLKEAINEALKEIRAKYWKTFLQSKEMANLMTQNIREQWYKKIEELKEYDFTVFNVQQVQYDVKMSLSKGIEDTILSLFDEFTRYALNEGGGNIHYYTGWKSNSAHTINKKVVLPYVEAYCTYSGHLQDYKVIDKLRDIEKVFNYIDNGTLQMDHADLSNTIKMNFKYGNTKNIELTYFSIDIFKKNTLHIKFNDKYADVLRRFNYIVGKLRNWLPPTYGNTDYDVMSEQDRAIVDSYCGKDTYIKEVQTRKDLYKFDVNTMLLGN